MTAFGRPKVALASTGNNGLTYPTQPPAVGDRSGTEVRMASAPPRIHPTAIIDPAARLAEDVVVGPYALIDGPVTLGPGCRVGPHAHLIGPLTLGADNIIHTGAVLGDRPQHLKFADPPTGIVAGNGNVFREHATVHGGMLTGGTRLGDNNYVMANAHMAHDCTLGNGVILCNGALLAGHCAADDGAFISGNCAIHQFTRIGRLSMLSGGATISKDLPPFCMGEGRNRLVGVNVVGMRRAGLSSRQINAVREAYRILFMQQKMLPAAIEQVERTLGETDTVAELLAFVRGSKRGVIVLGGYGAAA
jgi:UDP-N-acetylglucosamine acyltransferase